MGMIGEEDIGAYDGPKIAYGIFATIDNEKQCFGWVTKKRNALKICKRRTKRYGIRFYTEQILAGTEEHERSTIHNERETKIHTGPTAEEGPELVRVYDEEDQIETLERKDDIFTDETFDPETAEREAARGPREEAIDPRRGAERSVPSGRSDASTDERATSGSGDDPRDWAGYSETNAGDS